MPGPALETHISKLWFIGDRVYKVKKPVDLGFLDFTTPEARHRYCEEEVRLNQVLAPGIYLGVVPVVVGPDGLRVRERGEPAEWAVEMVRLPATGMLDHRLAKGDVDNPLIRALAERLVGFHRDAATGPGIDEHGTSAAVSGKVLGNLEQSERFVAAATRPGEPSPLPPVLASRLSDASRRFLGAQGARMDARAREGRVREGHGDLHAGNICETGGRLVIYDRIEFSQAFRCGDVAEDLAFLAMDFDRRGFPAFASHLVRTYAELAGDAEIDTLIDFYKAYRAAVRGKVAAIRAADPDLAAPERDAAIGEAAGYFQLATGYFLPAALILICGLPGSGKSHAARRLATPLRAAVLHSDVQRKRLAGVPPHDHRGEAAWPGLYGDAMTSRTYEALSERAFEILADGRTTIVDATFPTEALRRPFLDEAARRSVPAFIVLVEADDETVRSRLERRPEDPDEVSDADLAVWRKSREHFEPPDEIPAGRRVRARSGSEPDWLAGTRVAELRVGLSGA